MLKMLFSAIMSLIMYGITVRCDVYIFSTNLYEHTQESVKSCVY